MIWSAIKEGNQRHGDLFSFDLIFTFACLPASLFPFVFCTCTIFRNATICYGTKYLAFFFLVRWDVTAILVVDRQGGRAVLWGSSGLLCAKLESTTEHV